MTVSLCLLLAVWPRIGVAQSKEFRHVEVGALAGFLDLNTINGEKPLTLGLRAGYRVNTDSQTEPSSQTTAGHGPNRRSMLALQSSSGRRPSPPYAST